MPAEEGRYPRYLFPLLRGGSVGGASAAVTGTVDNGDLTWVGFASPPDLDWSYVILEGVVYLYVSTATSTTGTSAGTTFQLQGFPAALQPSANRTSTISAIDNNTAVVARAIMTTGGDLQFAISSVPAAPGPCTFSVSGWTGTGTELKGLHAGTTIVYAL